jgi:hypothetical protein
VNGEQEKTYIPQEGFVVASVVVDSAQEERMKDGDEGGSRAACVIRMSGYVQMAPALQTCREESVGWT